jgi:peptidoglycan/xylan/chitin deacetylase (PgdA/CDA1 family)
MSGAPDPNQPLRVARRDAQRRLRRRRRLIAVAAVAVFAAAGAAAYVWSSRAGHHPAPPRAVPDPRPQPVRVRPPAALRPHRAVVAPRYAATPASRTAAVPILMYHVIAPAPADAPYPGLYVTPHDFAAQVDELVRAGFHAVTLDQVRAAWLGQAGLPRRPIVLTFDNGYRSQYTEALPILRRVHWVADENLQLTGLPPSQGGLTERQVRALVAAGWELDTQGYDHADLTRLDPAQLRFQIAATRARLRRLYGVGVSWFCYPSGEYDSEVVAAVRAAGFVGSTTVVPGWARPDDDPYALPRLRVLAGTSPGELLAQIANAREAPAPAS